MIVHLRHSADAEHDEGRARARVFGEEAMGLYSGRSWPELEPQMADDWRAVRGDSPLDWTEVRRDAHAAWQVAKLGQDDCLRDHAPVMRAAASAEE
jgi:hypothetical protein